MKCLCVCVCLCACVCLWACVSGRLVVEGLLSSDHILFISKSSRQTDSYFSGKSLGPHFFFSEDMCVCVHLEAVSVFVLLPTSAFL